MEDPVPSSMVSGSSQFWRLAERRRRKAGSPNIFRGVDLQCLQQLFRASGDQDADQRAWLVWGHSNEADLAQALDGLQAHSYRSKRRVERARSTLGPKWLYAFGHLRISEGSADSPNEKEEENARAESSTITGSDKDLQGLENIQETTSTPNRPPGLELLKSRAAVSLWHKGGITSQRSSRNPERYLHRILH